MGGANIAISDRAEAGFWNPSGLGQVKAPQFAALLLKEKTGPSEIAKYQFLNYAAPIGVVGTFGVSLIHAGLWLGANKR